MRERSWMLSATKRTSRTPRYRAEIDDGICADAPTRRHFEQFGFKAGPSTASNHRIRLNMSRMYAMYLMVLVLHARRRTFCRCGAGKNVASSTTNTHAACVHDVPYLCITYMKYVVEQYMKSVNNTTHSRETIAMPAPTDWREFHFIPTLQFPFGLETLRFVFRFSTLCCLVLWSRFYLFSPQIVLRALCADPRFDTRV